MTSLWSWDYSLRPPRMTTFEHDRANVVARAFADTIGLASHSVRSYNAFIHDGIESIVDEHRITKIEHAGVEYTLQFGDHYFKESVHKEISEVDTVLTPKICLDRGMTYASELIQELTIKTPSGTSQVHKVSMGKIPIMVMSSLCQLTPHQHDPKKLIEMGEDIYDQGGYFIIAGKPKVIGCLEQMVSNRVYVFNDQTSQKTYSKIHSSGMDKSKETIFKLFLDGDRMMCSLPYIQDSFPVSVIFHALGVSSAAEIAHLVLPKSHDQYSQSLVEFTCQVIERSIDECPQFTNAESAIGYIGTIGKKFVKTFEGDERNVYIKQSVNQFATHLIDNELFPHMGQGPEFRQAKAIFLGYMIQKTVTVRVFPQFADDRDHMACKSIKTPGMLLHSLYSQLFHTTIMGTRKNVVKAIRGGDVINIKALFGNGKGVTSAFAAAINTNKWILKKAKISGLSQTYDKFNYTASLQCTRRVLKHMEEDSGQSEKPRDLHLSQWNAFCPASTPEGKKVGFVNEHSFLTTCSTGQSPRGIVQLLSQIPLVHTLDTIVSEDMGLLEYTSILVNGILVGKTQSPHALVSQLRSMKRRMDLNPETGIIHNVDMDEIHIQTEAGRVIRPCFVLTPDQYFVYDDVVVPEKTNVWWHLLKSGAIEMISKLEEEYSSIAASVSQVIPQKTRYEYCEIGPQFIYGSGASTIPFPDHNQSPRNSFQCAMGKQSVGIPGSNAMVTIHTKNMVLDYPHRPLAHTTSADIAHITDLPTGTNTVMMVYPMEGFNQEDSLIVNLDSVQMGFASCTVYIPYVATVRIDKQETLTIPNAKMCPSFHGNTSKLDPCGFVLRGTRVENGDVLVGIVSNQYSPAKSVSLKYDHLLPGTVYRSLVYTNKSGYKTIHIMIAQRRPLVESDKMSLPCGNKGTIGMRYRGIDLPQSLSGLRPDILINPLAFPSRMSFGIFFEGMTGRKVASKRLEDTPLADAFKMSRDASPFQGITIHDIAQELVKSGIPGFSEERVIDGRTGELASVLVFTGINYYQRLKHMGCDKISSRSKGQREKLTRQPLEGRSAGGGMRIGWQERDNFLANGATAIVKDRMMDNSDPSVLCVCKLCGYPGIHSRGRPEYGIQDKMMCTICDSDQVVYVNIPYATKLYIQESLAMGIGIRVIPESSKYVIVKDDQSILGEALLLV